jgi:hypothetical protein
MFVEVSKGELIDKITILEIKSEKITDPEKLKNVRYELETLRKSEFPTLIKKDLVDVNRQLWEVEDDLREFENLGKFDVEFVQTQRWEHRKNYSSPNGKNFYDTLM